MRWSLNPATPAVAATGKTVAVPVSVAVVTDKPVTLWDTFSGRLEAVDRVELRARVSGSVQAVHFSEGALVKQGDLLFTIDPQPYTAEVARSQARLEAAQAQLALARRDAARSQALVGSGAISRRDTDTRVSAFHEADANARAAAAALQTAQLNLAYTQVRAPIAGRVGRIEVTQGNLVAAGPGAPVLTTLVSVDPIYASFDADEQTVWQVLTELPSGKDARLELNLVPVRLGLSGQDGTPFSGHLQLVDNVVDAGSGTVRMRAVFPNPEGRLMPGQFARLKLGRPQPVPALLVSERAVGTDQDRKFVLVVGQDHRATYRQVTLGARVDGLRMVTQGLQAGETIVVDGLQRIRPGAVVAPQLVAQASRT
jgi:multidrug efflux system membrane fusion protein